MFTMNLVNFPTFTDIHHTRCLQRNKNLFEVILEKDKSQRQHQHDLLVQKLKSKQEEFGKSEDFYEDKEPEEEQLYGRKRT